MKFDLTKILESLQLTYNQLKLLLILSLVVIGLIWGLYTKGIISINNTEPKEDKSEVERIEKTENNLKFLNQKTEKNFIELYNNIMILNQKNNIYLDTKFNLFLKYYNNPTLLEELIKIQNEQQQELFNIDNQDIIKYKLLPDSLIN